MNEPVERYEPSYYGDMRWAKDGEWVEYADYARLKAEVERLEPELEQRCRELNLSLAQQAIQLRQIGELKAEVERLTIERNGFEQAMKANQSILETKRDENETLRNLAIKLDGYVDLVRHENERLRKAGDWMFNAIILNSDKDMGQAMDAWTAAKEGKPSV